MKLGRCPICHSKLHLEAIIQDDAGSELLGLLSSLGRSMARPLVQYLGLFRPAKSDLTNARAIRLAEEVLALGDKDILAAALDETVRSLHEKRLQGNVKPLTNHNYLKQVMASIAPSHTPSPSKNPNVDFKPQGKEETPEQSNAAWRAQMERLGVDVNKFRSNKKPGED